MQFRALSCGFVMNAGIWPRSEKVSGLVTVRLAFRQAQMAIGGRVMLRVSV
jgi:hypothetical protein